MTSRKSDKTTKWKGLFNLARLFGVAIGTVPIIRETIGGTADILQIITSSGGVLSVSFIAVTILVNIALSVYLSRQNLSDELPTTQEKPKARKARQLAEKIQLTTYRNLTYGLIATTVILGIVVILFLTRYQVQLDYQQVVAEFIEQTKQKDQPSETDYEPLAPPPGSIIRFWEQFRTEDYQVGQVPDNLTTYKGYGQLQIVIDPYDENNLVLQVLSDKDSFLLIPTEAWQGEVNLTMQTRVKLMSGEFLQEFTYNPIDIANDGNWHTTMSTYENNSHKFYLDGKYYYEYEMRPLPNEQLVNAGLRVLPYSTYLVDDFLIWENP